MDISVRKVEKSDLEEFTSIKAKAYADDRTKTIPLPQETPKWYDGEWYVGLGIPNRAENERLFEQFECYMICAKENVIGIFWLHCEEENSLTVEDLCILPEEQGKGYGSQALKCIEELYPENKRWLLTTPCFCKRNRHLYEKNGYVNIGLVAENTVIMYEKSIKKL